MDQHFFLTTFNAPLFDLPHPETFSYFDGYQTGFSINQGTPATPSNQKIIKALLNILKIFDEELENELRLNKLLLEKLCYEHSQCQTRNHTVKHEENHPHVVQLENVQAENIAQSVKQKKLAVNDTKNISKNFGKAVITFIQKNPHKIQTILQNYQVDFDVFSQQLKERKKNLISIKELRSLWLESQFEYAKPFREISYMFLRKASFKYIFGSRIADYSGHLKYRRRMIQALHSPKQFISIKH